MNETPELVSIFAQLRSDAWDKALDGIGGDKARAIIVQLFTRLPETERPALVRELDEIEHPWGEPGEWPEVGTDCWVHYRDRLHACRVALEDVEIDVQEWEKVTAVCLQPWDEMVFITDYGARTMRFRKRWTPEKP